MRVALLTNFIPPYRIAFFQALQRAAGELRVFVSTEMEANRDWQPEWGSLDVVVQKTWTLHRTWRTDAFSEKQEIHVPYDAVPQLRRYQPDLIISGELGARSVQAMLYAKVTGTKCVLWATLSDRLEQQRGGLRKFTRKWLLRNADHVIVNGGSGARYVKRFGVADARVLRMPYTTDMSQLLALPLERAEHQDHELLYVGAVSERKGTHLLIDAANLWAAQHPDRTLTVTVVGNGPLRARLELQPKQPNLGLTWIQHVAYKDLPKIYGKKGIFIFPTLGDEWGLVVNEALAAGLPVLGSTYSAAVEELIKENENGWTFEPTDAATIASAIDKVLNTTSSAMNTMRQRARASAEELSPENAARKLIEELKR